MSHQKQYAIAFYRMAFEGNPRQAIDQYVGNDYKQHNPDVKDGKAGFIEYFERMQSDYPNKSIEFVRCIEEDDLVALHTHQIWHDGDTTEEYVMMDFFRFDAQTKIVEHWDAIQKIPEKTASGNTMY